MVNLAPDVKPILPGRHPLLPRQPPAGLSPVTGSFLPQQPSSAFSPIRSSQHCSTSRYLSPVKERSIDAWRKITHHEYQPAPAADTEWARADVCHSALSAKTKSAPASLSDATLEQGLSCPDAGAAGECCAPRYPSNVLNGNTTPSRNPSTTVSPESSPVRGYYSTKKYRMARREHRQMSQSMPHVLTARPEVAGSIIIEDTPPHNWGAEMNYTPREPVAPRVPATIINKASPRIAGARDPVSQKYWRTMFPAPAPHGASM